MSSTTTNAPEAVGSLPDGRAVQRFTLAGVGAGRLQVLDAGAAAMSYRLVADDPSTEVLVGFGDAVGYLGGLAGGYFGCIVGRYANRIAGGRFTVDGVEHQVVTNEAPNTLHGGADGFSHRVWTLLELSDDRVVLGLSSPDGDQGFPGAVEATATYTLVEDGFTLDLAATTDAPTPLGLTSHLYLNLAGGGTINEHLLQVPASRYVPIDAASIPTSGPVPVAGTPFDFREPAPIGARVRVADEQIGLAKGIDHSFDVDGAGLREVAVVREPVTGRVLRLVSDAPALQVYTGNFLDGALVWAGAVGAGAGGGEAGAQRLRQGDAMALEPHDHPDSPNQDWAEGVILRPGQRWSRRIEWHFDG
ncbi:aldose epimerase family protein [Aestuariimicrobium sp. Y1814]|uniref:aldose epimerase family protein n=1 Tax=Aestuariimicrobium sp. Y1814 TaxID=3418742 RepID=UPI003DA76B9C